MVSFLIDVKWSCSALHLSLAVKTLHLFFLVFNLVLSKFKQGSLEFTVFLLMILKCDYSLDHNAVTYSSPELSETQPWGTKPQDISTLKGRIKWPHPTLAPLLHPFQGANSFSPATNTQVARNATLGNDMRRRRRRLSAKENGWRQNINFEFEREINIFSELIPCYFP